jgi:hypothetical protein|tara:strand:+ start:229 stop:792 length:564 start_codon:yes stop_codon:yes gene_type:complete
MISRISSFRAVRTFSTAVYANFTCYKTESALQIAPIKPTLEAAGNGLKVQREGTILLSLATARGTLSEHGYDWQNKQIFALSVIEMGEVLAQRPGHPLLTFVHGGEGMGGGDAKTLQVGRSGDDGALQFALQTGPATISISMSAGENEVLRSLITHCIPRMLAFDVALDGVLPDHGGADGNDWAFPN